MSEDTQNNLGENVLNGKPVQRRSAWSMEAEQSVLGAILLDNAVMDQVADLLVPNDFYLGAHQVIYQAMKAVMELGDPADPIILNQYLEKNNHLDSLESVGYLAQLLEAVPTAANTKSYAKLVQTKSILRALFRQTGKISETVFDGERSDDEILEESVKQILELGESLRHRRTNYAVDKYIHNDDDHLVVSFTQLETFSKDDIAAFNRINDKFTELELNLKQEVSRQLELLNERLADKESWISDYEVELSIKLYLKESDPRYNDDIDNIVFDGKTSLLPCATASHKIGAEDWFENTPMYEPYGIDKILERPMCELFHIIFDHHDFPQAEAKNTGTIWVDILVVPQMEIIL
jgi:hypothetical protein